MSGGAYYCRDGPRITSGRPLSEQHQLLFVAENIRNERTSPHARVAIYVNRVQLAYSTFNIDRDEERTRLVNTAHAHLTKTVEKKELKYWLDVFCAGLWNAWCESLEPELVEGAVDPKPPRSLVHPFVLDGGGTLIFAPPGRGKSWLLLLMAVSLDAGVDKLWPINRTPVLVINLERSAGSYRQRLGAVNRLLGLAPNRPLMMQNVRGRTLDDVIDGARHRIDRDHIGCVFLDSISRAGFGDLNENRAVNGIMDALNGLCNSWVALAHTPRNDETHVFGSVHFDAGADVIVRLTTEETDAGDHLGIGLDMVKANDIKLAPLQTLDLTFGPALLADVAVARPGQYPIIETGARKTMRQATVEYLLDNDPTSATVLARELGYSRQKISNLLNHDDVFVRASKAGRDQRYTVLFPERVTGDTSQGDTG